MSDNQANRQSSCDDKQIYGSGDMSPTEANRNTLKDKHQLRPRPATNHDRQLSQLVSYDHLAEEKDDYEYGS